VFLLLFLKLAGVAGKDATEAFYGLHRHEILEKAQYKRLQIGTLKDEKSVIYGRIEGAVSDVPYAEPTWLSKGYHSPYYKDTHRQLHKELRKFVDNVMYPDAQAREEDGKRPSQAVFDDMAYVVVSWHLVSRLTTSRQTDGTPCHASGARQAPEGSDSNGWSCEAGRGSSELHQKSCSY
jgi:hypothetical protein